MITVYSKNNCPKCVQAKSVLNANGVDYIEVNIDEDAKGYKFIVDSDHKSLPQIYKDGVLFVDNVPALLKMSREGKLK